MTTRAALADRLELALRRLDRWSDAPLDPARLVDMGPFGMHTLAPEEWLQHILLARLRGPDALPASSELGPWATRNFDGDPDAAALLDVLRAIDTEVTTPIRGTIELARAYCTRFPMVASAYLVQLYAPDADQLTSPALGLVLTAPLPADAFTAWPAAEHPLVVFLLGDDAISRLARLTPPIYRAPDRPPPGMSEFDYYR